MSLSIVKAPSGFPRWDLVCNGQVVQVFSRKHEAEARKREIERKFGV